MPARHSLCAERPSCGKAALSSTSSSCHVWAPWPGPVPRGSPPSLGAQDPPLPGCLGDWVLRGSGIVSTGCAGTGPLQLLCAPAALARQRQPRQSLRQGWRWARLQRWSLACCQASWRLGPLPRSPGPAGLLPLASLHPQGEPLCGLQVTQPTGCLSPARGLGCAHCHVRSCQ